MKKTQKEKPLYIRAFPSDRDFINIECAKKKMSQPEFIQALLKVYKTHWKAGGKKETTERIRAMVEEDKKRYR